MGKVVDGDQSEIGAENRCQGVQEGTVGHCDGARRDYLHGTGLDKVASEELFGERFKTLTADPLQDCSTLKKKKNK